MADTATIREYAVTGMSCQHCVNAITEDVGAVPGVSAVQVDLEGGRVTVTSDDGQMDDAAVRSAIEETGYEVGG